MADDRTKKLTTKDLEEMILNKFRKISGGNFANPSVFAEGAKKYESMAYKVNKDSPDVVAREIFAKYGNSFAEEVAKYLSRGSATEREFKLLQEKVKEYAETFAKLQKMACPYAHVVEVRNDKVVINFAGKNVECEKPEKKNITPGCTVKVTGDTLQVVDVVEDDARTGEVVQVTRVADDKTCEVERAGSTRALSYSGKLEEGDRVVVDPSGNVVIKNLGKPPNDCVFDEPTGVCWDDIGGLEQAKLQMREAIEAPTKHADLFVRYGKKPIKGVLLYGSPGCGKTLLGKAAATAIAELHGREAGAFIYVKGPQLLNMWVGNTEQNIRKLFDQAGRHKKQHGYPAIIFVDEADAILGKRRSGELGTSLSSTLVPAFLAEMDGMGESGALVLLATNRPDTLDPAIVREGRIDRRIKVTRPNKDEARDILFKHLRGKPLSITPEEAVDASVDALYDSSMILYRVRTHSSVGKGKALTFGHVLSGASLAGIVERATSNAMHREIGGGEAGIVADDFRHAAREAFHQARDINHEDEIAEFCEGWEKEVAGIDKVRGSERSNAPASGN